MLLSIFHAAQGAQPQNGLLPVITEFNLQAGDFGEWKKPLL